MFFIWIAQASDAYKLTHYELPNLANHFPMFVFGIVLVDSEFIFETWRPLDSIRRWGWALSVLRNLVLVILFLSYGSYVGKERCE